MTEPITDPILTFALLMVTVLVAPLVFQKLRLPSLLGLICAGAVIGPSVLGLLERDRTMVLLGSVGLVFLMFVAGLSMDLSGFLKAKRKSISFGLASYLFPALLALVAGPWLLGFDFAASVMLGSIVGSHTLLAYPIVSRIGITKNSAVTIAMGGTLVTDVVSLGVLAVVMGANSGTTDLTFWLLFAMKVGVFVLGALTLLPRLGRWFFRTVKYDSNTDFLFMLSVLFFTAWSAELAGLAPIIGAFLAGLMMNRLVPESGTLMSRIQFVGSALFVPFFLVSVGLLVDVSVLGQAEVWRQALVFAVLVLLGKGGSSLLVGRLIGFTPAERWVVAGLTIPQAAATLAVTLIGFEIGLFSEVAVNAVILLILISCLIGPVLVERHGRKVALQDEGLPYDPTTAPQRILVPLANPETAEHLMEIAMMVHDPSLHEPIYPLIVCSSDGDVAANVARSERMLASIVEFAAATEYKVSPVTRVDLNIAKGISRAVLEKRVSTVIIGWNGEVSTRSAIFGSVLDQLLEEVEVQVVVCKITSSMNLFRRVVLALPPFASLESGFSDVLRTVKLMVEQLGATLVIVTNQALEPHLKEKAETVRPLIDIKWQDLESWEELLPWVAENRQAGDLLVLASARQGAVSWRESLDELPRNIAKKQPDLCFAVIYSSELEWAQAVPVALA